MTDAVSLLVIPILAGLIAFAIIGRVLSLWQQPTKHTRWEMGILAEYGAGLWICLAILFHWPLAVRVVGYGALVVSFIVSNIYVWSSLIDHAGPVAPVATKGDTQTLGTVAETGAQVTLVAVEKPTTEAETTQKAQEAPEAEKGHTLPG